MKTRRRMNLMPLAVIAGLAPSLARASDLQPTPLGEQVDILGLRPGQTPDQVRAILAKADSSGELQEGKATDPGTNQPYVGQTKFIVRHPDPRNPGKFELVDVVDVVFSAPASGNIALNIHREAHYFGDARPVKARMLESLEQKYGQSPYAPAITQPDQPSEAYVYDANGRLSPASDPAYRNNCRPMNPGGSFSNMCGVANLYWVIFESYAPMDPDRAGGLRVDLRDNALALKALAIDQAADRQKRLREQANAPGAKL